MRQAPRRCGRWRSQTPGSGGRTRPGLCTVAPSSARAGRLFRGLGLRVGVARALPWLFLFWGRARLFLKTLLVHPACRRDFSQGPSLSVAPGRGRGLPSACGASLSSTPKFRGPPRARREERKAEAPRAAPGTRWPSQGWLWGANFRPDWRPGQALRGPRGLCSKFLGGGVLVSVLKRGWPGPRASGWCRGWLWAWRGRGRGHLAPRRAQDLPDVRSGLYQRRTRHFTDVRARVRTGTSRCCPDLEHCLVGSTRLSVPRFSR